MSYWWVIDEPLMNCWCIVDGHCISGFILFRHHWLMSYWWPLHISQRSIYVVMSSPVQLDRVFFSISLSLSLSRRPSPSISILHTRIPFLARVISISTPPLHASFSLSAPLFFPFFYLTSAHTLFFYFISDPPPSSNPHPLAHSPGGGWKHSFQSVKDSCAGRLRHFTSHHMKRDSRLDLLERNLFVTLRFTPRHLTRHENGERWVHWKWERVRPGPLSGALDAER